MKLKKHSDFLSESSFFDQYQTLKQLMYEINEYGKYKIYKENWYIYENDDKVGSYYMFIDNNKTLIIDKLNFDQDMEESKQEKRDHAKLFLEQLINFCNDHQVVAAVSPDRIRDRKVRKKVKDFYKEHGFVANRGDKMNSIVTETMYRPL